MSRETVAVAFVSGAYIQVRVDEHYQHGALTLAKTIAAARAERTIRERQAPGEQR